MKRLVFALAFAVAFIGFIRPASAVQSQATIDVQVNIPPTADLTFIANADENSVGQPTVVVFDAYDREDCGAANGGSWFDMYAPTRCGNAGKNWHAAEIFINTDGTFSVEPGSVTGDVDGFELGSLLNIGFGGFFGIGHGGAIVDGDGKNPDATFWEISNAFVPRSIPTGFFSGKAYLMYRLNMRDAGGNPIGIKAGNYTGQLVYTLATLN